MIRQGRKRRLNETGNLTYFDDIRTAANATMSQQPGSAVQVIDNSFRLLHILSMFSAQLHDNVGISVELGGFLAMQHFNERSGAVIQNLPDLLQNCNVYWTFDLLETGSSPTTAVRELVPKIPPVPSLSTPSPMSILGSGRSSTTESLSIIGAVNNVATTSCCATSQELSDKTQHPYFSRTTPTNLGNARAAALYFKAIGIDHVATLHIDDVYGVDFSRLFQEEAKRLEIDVVSISFRPSSDHDIRQAAEQIKLSNRTYVLGMFYASELVRVADIASQADIMGSNTGYVWILGEGGNQLSLVVEPPEIRPRLLNATNGIGWIQLHVPANERYNAALESFKSNQELQEYYLSKKIVPQQMASSLNFSNVFVPDYALLNYDAAIAMGLAACEAPQTFFTAGDFYNTLVGLDFVGATGHVAFNNETGTRVVTDVAYTIQNLLSSPSPTNESVILLESIESAVIQLTPSDTKVTIVNPFIYADNTTNQPLPLPPGNHNRHLIPTWALGLGLFLCALIMLMSIGWCAWSVYYRKQRMVRASQPFFLVMLCIGTFLIAASIIPTSFQEPMSERTLNAGCMLFPWLLCTGFVTAFSALFTKNGRINAIFMHAQACRRVTIKPKNVIMPFLILLGLNVILLVCWTISAPWEWDRVYVGGKDQYKRPTDSYGVCVSDRGALSQVFVILLAAVNVVPILLSVYQSYKTRNLPSEFNESKYLAISMTFLLETFGLGLPVVLIAVDPTAVFLTRSVVLCAACLAILIPMFAPKFFNKSNPARPPRLIRSVLSRRMTRAQESHANMNNT